MISTDKVSNSRKCCGRNLRQFILFIFSPFPGSHVEQLQVGRNPPHVRGQVLSKFLLLEDSIAAVEKKRAESLKRCHYAGNTRLDILPEIRPNKIAVVKNREASASNSYHGSGETKKNSETNLLRDSKLCATKEDDRYANNWQCVNHLLRLECCTKHTHDISDDIQCVDQTR